VKDFMVPVAHVQVKMICEEVLLSDELKTETRIRTVRLRQRLPIATWKK
jgi:hypothetical protein